ncbi:hypothetical protein F4803DRAFT_531986 [Xylaria telfairii]|nr:hypothetical protein F4803DRAFT_531986 [Xylaria telfairii]
MNTKRKYSRFGAENSAADETGEYAPSHHSSKYNAKKGPSKERPTSINWLKKRARTIERRLNREDSLPANVKHDLEKELDHHKHKLGDIADAKKRSAMIKKYHMIRFFERKKADRLAKQIRTQLGTITDEGERQKLQAGLHIAEVDSLYAKYFPYRERYVSLYPVTSVSHKGPKTEDTSAAARSLYTERPPLWETIEKEAKNGIRRLIHIQERKSAVDSKGKPSQKQPSKHSSAMDVDQPEVRNSSTVESTDHHKARGKHQQPPESPDSGGDDESDGGFFEEG